MLEIRNLSVKYEEVILDSISLKLEKGIYRLVGKTGSGKSTFIKAISGFINYDGEILLNGNIVEKRKGFQIVFQNPFDSFDPMKTIKYSLEEIMRLNSNFVDIESLSEEMGINKKFIHKYPDELSGGELQRLSILRALVGNPEVLLLDEPTSALDVENKRKIIDIIKKIKAKIIILVSHDLYVVQCLTNNILVLNQNTKKIEYNKGENK